MSPENDIPDNSTEGNNIDQESMEEKVHVDDSDQSESRICDEDKNEKDEVAHTYNTKIETHTIDSVFAKEVIFEQPDRLDAATLFEDCAGLTAHFQLSRELSTEISSYRKTLLDQRMLVINCLDGELNETVCKILFEDAAFTGAKQKTFDQAIWGNEVPNAIGPLIKLMENEEHIGKSPLVLRYYESADMPDTTLLFSLIGERRVQDRNTRKLRAINAYFIYILKAPSKSNSSRKITIDTVSFFWPLHFYPHILRKHAGGNLYISMQSYFDRILEQNGGLRTDDAAFYGLFTETIRQGHPESFYLNPVHIQTRVETIDPDKLNSILDNQLCLAIVYIQCYFPFARVREYDTLLAILFPEPSETTQPVGVHPLMVWRENPDRALNDCMLAPYKAEDGSTHFGFSSIPVRDQFRVLLESRRIMRVEKLTENLRCSLLLFKTTQSSELQTSLINLFKDALLRLERSARVRELIHWFQTWDVALRESNPKGVSGHSKMVARLLAELMIEEHTIPIVTELFEQMARDSYWNYFLLEILFTLARWFNLPDYIWLKKLVNSDNGIISAKAIRFIYHTIRFNNLSLSETIEMYSSWLPDTSKQQYAPSERFALGLFSELLDDTHIGVSQWGDWAPKVSVFRNCEENYKQTITSICKVLLHPGVIQELEARFKSNHALGYQAVGQALALHYQGFNHPRIEELKKKNNYAGSLSVAAEILYTWKVSELLVYWCMILQGTSPSRMDPKARTVREELMYEIVTQSTPLFRMNLLSAWTIAERIKYDNVVTSPQVRDVRLHFQSACRNLPKN